MITKLTINNNKNTPLHYLSKLKGFKNGTEYEFKQGVNIIVGKNGCGKTTLMELIKSYLSVDGEWCGKGLFDSSIHKIVNLRSWISDKEDTMKDGVDLYADYKLNTFCYTPFESRSNQNFLDMGNYSEICLNMDANSMSKRQKANNALSTLFQKMISKDAVLKFDYESVYVNYKCYLDYISKHRVAEKPRVITILMDEPDNSVDIDHILQLYKVFTTFRPETQIIAVLHNPFLISKLSENENVNIIEMSKGYVKIMQKAIKNFEKL